MQDFEKNLLRFRCKKDPAAFSAFDLWGIQYKASAKGKTYEIYELTVQDRPFGDRLTAHLTPAGPQDDLDLFAANMPYEPQKILAEKFGFPDYEPLETRMQGGDTARGTTISYRVRCSVYVSMQYIFVRESGGTWQHAYTTNAASAAELHDWYVVRQANRDLQTESDERLFSLTQYPLRWTERYAEAVSAFRRGECRTDSLATYVRTVFSETASAAAFSVPLPCPPTPGALLHTS